jgi:iron(III) transport system ATP-binding protein
MININNLNFKYQKHKHTKIVNDISFKINKGELVCLLGPSGCGKTSTLRLIAGLEIPNTGTISIAGTCVNDKNIFIEPHRRDVGFLFQDFALFPHLTAKENIAWGLSNKDETNKKTRIEELLIQTSMTEQADKYPHELSGGEQQRVALARALAPRPSLLLLDEPFSSLDTTLRHDIREETRQILKATNTTSIVVTHDPEEAMLIADKIILMHDGAILQQGSAQEIYDNPKNNFVASFFGYINRVDGIAQGKIVKTIIGDIPNQDFPNNTQLDIIARPHSLSVSKPSKIEDKRQYASIESIKFMGTTSHIWCKVENIDNIKQRILVTQEGKDHFKKGDKVDFIINKKNVYMFEKIESK